MPNIYIVGFMATGKSAVGSELARLLSRQFLDLDALIELKEKKGIPAIFAEDGEPYFRSLEKQVLKETTRKNGLIIACGGGIVIDPENIRLMKETGTIICLTASVDVILQRSSSQTNRPLLNVSGRKAQIEALLKKRASFYILADKTIDTSLLSVTQAAEKILKDIV